MHKFSIGDQAVLTNCLDKSLDGMVVTVIDYPTREQAKKVVINPQDQWVYVKTAFSHETLVMEGRLELIQPARNRMYLPPPLQRRNSLFDRL